MIDVEKAIILENTELIHDVYRMRINSPEIAELCKPGQFVNLYTGDASSILPRPISICRLDKKLGVITLLYRIEGKGTRIFAGLKADDSIRVFGPLGNGFKVQNGTAVLIGGGIGIPPLLELAADLRRTDPDRIITAYLGYRDKNIFLADEFNELCSNVEIATDDGSIGFHGNTCDLIKSQGGISATAYACGPIPMLRGLSKLAQNSKLFLSLEERMGCGFGACVGCAVKTANTAAEQGFHYKRCCMDGPVFIADDLVFEDGDR
ncbi:MAG: dihydroorotate dehydrogenase electron transfer subunit [Defluviitaleaceae bacterium]|nr:dihydroorotate dehydrogenase electron transfer subunit [Defluviitaleaceae bacterium]